MPPPYSPPFPPLLVPFFLFLCEIDDSRCNVYRMSTGERWLVEGFFWSGKWGNGNRNKNLRPDEQNLVLPPTPHHIRPLYVVGVGGEGGIGEKTKDRGKREFNSENKKMKGKPIEMLWIDKNKNTSRKELQSWVKTQIESHETRHESSYKSSSLSLEREEEKRGGTKISRLQTQDASGKKQKRIKEL